MLSDSTKIFTKTDLDIYLKELAKEYKRINGKSTPAEIILIGGAAILANYGFRDMTTDVDAIITAATSMKDAINHVGDRYQLPNGWLNENFRRTPSYSPKLIERSKYYKSFYGMLEVRTIRAADLVAMKLRAGRKYKNDLSDIIGILAEHEKRGSQITREQVDEAVEYLYGSWDVIPEESRNFIEETLQRRSYEQVYEIIRKEEKRSKELLVDFQEDYPDVANQANVNAILEHLKKKNNH